MFNSEANNFRDLVAFLSRMELTPSNFVITNTIDDKSETISQYYTPHKQVSELSRKIMNGIEKERIDASDGRLTKDSLGYNILYTDFLNHYPKLKVYMRIILVECISISLTTQERNSYIKHLDEEDIDRLRETVKYVLNVIGMDLRYSDMITQLDDINVYLGYIQAQLPLIHKELDVIE